MKAIIDDSLRQAARVKSRAVELIGPHIAQAADLLGTCLANDGRAYIVGNGGSAADAQHFAAEFTGRFGTSRRALPVVALTTDTSALTCIGNDFGFEHVFARQVEALGRAGDVFLALSTSGDSPNVVQAARSARSRGMTVIGLTGASGGALQNYADLLIKAPSPVTARIQELHMTALHIICDLTERLLGVAPSEPGFIDDLESLRARWRRDQLTVVSTNGCFDVLHAGHLDSLGKASRLGDVLVVLTNSDDSIARLKGPSRPVNTEQDRVMLLSALSVVDYVFVFSEDDPSSVLDRLQPDVHCKGDEYEHQSVPEAAVVEKHGGRMHYLSRELDLSTSALIAKMSVRQPLDGRKVIDVG